MTTTRLIWSRLGDSRLVSWPTFLITTVIFLLDGAFNARDHDANLTAVFVGVAAAQVTSFGMLSLARVSRVTRSRPFVMVILIVIASIIGVIVGGLVQTSIGPSGFIQLETAIYRALVIAIVGIVVVSWRRYGEAMHSLRATRDRLIQTRADGALAFIEERRQVVDQVTAMLDASIGDINVRRTDDSAQLLQHAAQEIIRPLSHELAQSLPDFNASDIQPRAVRWRQLFDDVSSAPLISPIFMAIAVTVLAGRLTVTEVPEELTGNREGLGVVVDSSSFVISLSFLGVLFAAVWLTSFVVRRLTAPLLLPRSGAQRLGITIVGLLVIMVVTGIVIGVFREGSGDRDVLAGMIGALPILAVAVVLAAFRLVLARLALNEQALQAVNDELTWEVARTREALWQQRRAMARAIHGPLQAAVTAGGLQLRTAHDPDAVIRQLQANIADALHEVRGDRIPISMAEQLRAIEQTWAGVCAVDVTVADDVLIGIQADPMTATATIEIVQEAVANAARHGQARHTWVGLACPENRHLQITVRDDGSPRPGEPVPGLGSAVLDEVCLTWELDRGPEGSTLHAVLPLAAEARHDWHST